MDTLWLTDAEKANIKMNVRKWRVKPGPPVITIFVSHSANCKYRGDEFCKRCDCPKHLRWSHYGKQNRVSAHTRSWAEAENKKRDIEDQLSGRANSAGVSREMPCLIISRISSPDQETRCKVHQSFSQSGDSQGRTDIGNFTPFTYQRAEIRGCGLPKTKRRYSGERAWS